MKIITDPEDLNSSGVDVLKSDSIESFDLTFVFKKMIQKRGHVDLDNPSIKDMLNFILNNIESFSRDEALQIANFCKSAISSNDSTGGTNND